jgi:FkbM family methyltransferase
MSLKKIFFKTKLTYNLYLYYNLYIRHKCFIKRNSYSQWGEDLIIDKFFQNKKNGFYLDVGGYHPYTFNNTLLLHRKGWRGINVDINPTSIDLFNIARPNDVNICSTIDEKKRNFKMYFDGPFSSVNTLNEEFYNSAKKRYFKNTKFLSVKSKTIDEVIKISKVDQYIDFINIDVEGSDFEILKQIDLQKYQVKLLAVETHNVDGSKVKDFNQISEFLNKNNFLIYESVGPTSIFRNKIN